MNKQEFYKGMLAELKKTAAIQQPPQKKNSIFKSPVFWGGLGAAAGLGGYELYKHLNSSQAPSVPQSAATKGPVYPETPTTNFGPDESTLKGELSTAAAKSIIPIGLSSSAASGVGAGLGQMAPRVSSNLPGLAKTIGGAGHIASDAGKMLGRTAVGAGGVSQILDAYDPNTNMPEWARHLQAGGGAADAAIQIAGKNAIKGGLTRLAGSTASEVALGGAARGAGMLFGAPMYAAYGTGLAGQMALDRAGGAAETLSNEVNPVGDALRTLQQGFKSTDPQVHNKALLNANWLYNSPDGQEILDKVRIPDNWARWGSNPTGFGRGAELSTITNLLDKYKKMMENEVETRKLQMPKYEPKPFGNTMPYEFGSMW